MPGSITISGATVDRSDFVNGNFEPTSELCNGKTVYKKKGDEHTWLELVKSPDNLEWGWYIKPTSARGPGSALCYGYGMCFHEYNDPQECFSFHVYDGSKFTCEKDVICIMEKGQQGDDDDDKNDINDYESGAVNNQQDDDSASHT